MGNLARHGYEFGSYRMDPARNLLLRDDEPVPLTHKAFETLLVLVEHGSQGASKDELMKTLWPDTFVGEANLTKHISMVRKALGESAQDHRYIVTLPGRGYRFAETVRIIPGHQTDAVLVQAKQTGETPARLRPRSWNWILAIASVLVLVSLGAVLARRSGAARALRSDPALAASSRTAARGGSSNPTAVEYCLKGQYFWNRRDNGGLVKAAEYFQRATEADPNYAAAYAGLAQSWAMLGQLEQAKLAADKALSLDPGLAEAHTALGLIYDGDWNFLDTEKEFKLAISLNPNYATAHHWYGESYLVLMGRFAEADQEMKQARTLDPVSRIIATDQGAVLYFERRYDEAYEELSKVLEMEPAFSEARMFRGAVLLRGC